MDAQASFLKSRSASWHRVLEHDSRLPHRAALLCALLHVLAWFALRPSEQDLGNPWIRVLGGLKLLTLTALAFQLRSVHIGLGRGQISARRALVSWSLGLVVTLAVLTPLREFVASAFHTATTRLVSIEHGFGYTFLGLGPSDEEVRSRHFLVQWRRGEIFALESLLAMAIAAAHVFFARGFKRRAGFLSLLYAGLLSLALCAAWAYAFGLVWNSYDLFYLGSMTGPLAIDCAIPAPLYPTTPLASPFYLAVAISSWAIRGVPGGERRRSAQFPMC